MLWPAHPEQLHARAHFNTLLLVHLRSSCWLSSLQRGPRAESFGDNRPLHRTLLWWHESVLENWSPTPCRYSFTTATHWSHSKVRTLSSKFFKKVDRFLFIISALIENNFNFLNNFNSSKAGGQSGARTIGRGQSGAEDNRALKDNRAPKSGQSGAVLKFKRKCTRTIE